VVGEGAAGVGTAVGEISQASAANRQTTARLKTGLRFMKITPELLAEHYHQMRKEALVLAFKSPVKSASTSIWKIWFGATSPMETST